MTVATATQIDLRLHAKQSQAFTSPATEILYGGAAGGGKALACDTPIATTKGWALMGTLQVGDMVFDETGHPCKVIAATPVMEGRTCYEVIFSDGSKVVADANHLWWVYSLADRQALSRRSDEYRAKRRANRPINGTGKRPDLTLRNQERRAVYAPPVTGNILTTAQIAASIKVRGRVNYSIPVAKPLDLPAADLPIPPYTLGAWLGDGTSSQAAFTTADPEMVQFIEEDGFQPTKRKAKYAYGVLGLLPSLKDLRLLNNKHIPQVYLRASFLQRQQLLQGLMDTDGHADARGQCEYTTTSPQLAVDFLQLLLTLGIKANICEGDATLDGRVVGRKYRIKFLTDMAAFKLPRKCSKQKRGGFRGTHAERYIVAINPVESVPVRCIQVDSPRGVFLAGAGLIPTHNSHLMRVAAIAWCTAIPGLQVYLFRRTYPELLDNHINGSGSFLQLLAPWIASKLVKVNLSKLEIEFTFNGSKIHLCHCQNENDVVKYQGAEIHVLLIDELTHFTSYQFRFLRGRCRIGGLPVPDQYKGQFPRILCGSNPGGVGHNWVKMSFVDNAPESEIAKMGNTEGGMLRQFIRAKLDDNPTLRENDPDYRQRLQGLGDAALVKAMEDGDWNIVSGGMFDDVWRQDRHVIAPFEIPSSWYVDRSFDWGSSAPFSVGWWAESDGTEATMADGTKRNFPAGTLFRINELYGWNGKPNEGCKMLVTEIADEIIRVEADMGLDVAPGPADSSIYDTENGNCLGDDFADKGIYWTRADKTPGSRKTGWEKMRARLKAGLKFPMEEPGLFVFDHCLQFIRTVPVLPRDKTKSWDVDTNSEDHIADESRYKCLSLNVGHAY